MQKTRNRLFRTVGAIALTAGVQAQAADKEQQEKPQMIDIANERLKILNGEFDPVSIKYEKRFFS